MTIDQTFVDNIIATRELVAMDLGKKIAGLRTGRDMATTKVLADGFVCFNVGFLIKGYEYSSGVISDELLLIYHEIVNMLYNKHAL